MAGEDGRRRLFAAGVPDALRAAADLLAEAATARSGPYSGASPGALAKVVAGVEPFPEEGAGLDGALAGLGRLSLRHGVDPGHPACAAHLHCQPLAAAVAADALAAATNQSLDSWAPCSARWCSATGVAATPGALRPGHPVQPGAAAGPRPPRPGRTRGRRAGPPQAAP